MFQRLSLRTRFVLFSLACLVPLCVVVVVFLNLSMERNTELRLENETIIADTVDRTVVSYFDDTASALERIAADPAVSALDPSAQILNQAPRLDLNVFLVDAKGTLISPTTNPPTELVSGLSEQFTNTLTNRQVALSPRIEQSDDTSIIVMTVPVVTVTETETDSSSESESTNSGTESGPASTGSETTPPGQVVGVLGAVIRMDTLEQLVLPLATGDTDLAIVRTNNDILLGTAGVMSDQQGFIQRNSEVIDLARSGRASDVDTTSSDGSDLLGVYRPTTVEGNTWATIVTSPAPGSFFDSLWFQGLTVMLLAGLVILALAVVLGELTARPLRVLAVKAESMAAGDFSSRIEPIGSGEILRLSTSLSGMSEQLEEQLDGLQEVQQVRESQTRQMRDLLRRTLRLQEDEQRRIAAEIHDAVSPLITGALYQARALQMSNGSTPPEEREAALGSVNSLLERATNELHGVIFDLRPPDLDDLGIVAAIQAYVSSIRRSNVNVHLDLGEEPPGLSSEVRLGMYRIVQEALHNVMRHSGADEALVRLEFMDHHVRLTIRDNGSGFDPDTSVRPTSLGLLSMRERAAAIGATLNIVSRAGGGTAIILERTHTESVMSDDVLADLISVENMRWDGEIIDDDTPDAALPSAATGKPVHNGTSPSSVTEGDAAS
jgi:signal transduction histidine kinase